MANRIKGTTGCHSSSNGVFRCAAAAATHYVRFSHYHQQAGCFYSVVTIVMSSAFVILSFQVGSSSSYRGTLHPLTYQRQIDYLDVEQYFRNARLMRIQIMCIIYDEPCDFVGRWLKPRLFPALFGDCPVCSDYQQKKLPQWLWIFADKYPVMFRAAVAQFLLDQGYPVPAEEIPKIQRAFGFRDTRKILNPRGVINATLIAPIGARKDTGPALISYFGRRRTAKSRNSQNSK